MRIRGALGVLIVPAVTIGGSSLPIRSANTSGAEDVIFDAVGVARAVRAGTAALVAAIRDPESPSRLPASYDADHLHPTIAGRRATAGAIDLRMFAR